MSLTAFKLETGSTFIDSSGEVTVILSSNFATMPSVMVTPVDTGGNVDVYVYSVSLVSGQWNVVIRASAGGVSVDYQAIGL